MKTAGGRNKRDSVTIKGTGSGLLIRLRDDASAPGFGDLMVDLEAHLQQSAQFFRKAPTSIDLGRRELDVTELEKLQSLVLQYEMSLESIISGSNATRSAARQLGLNIHLPSLANTQAPAPPDSESGPAGLPFDSAEAFFVRRTIRSGQVVQHHSDICILGDVNPGAEIIAGGSVIVWGVLRGVVHAGAGAGKAATALICALDLSPTQLRIGDAISRAPEARGDGALRPEVAQVRDGRIVVEPWTRRKF